MIVYDDVIQGTPQWAALRAGIPTASQFSNILTPNWKPSKSQDDYLYSLLAERMLGRPLVEHMSHWMDRGAEMEAEAVAFYELQRNCDTTKIGFVTNDSGTVGASPDRLVQETGLLEIKVPKESTHVSYLFKDSVKKAYFPQIQGQLWVCEKEWLDIVSYHPELPPALVRVERDEPFIHELATNVLAFSHRLEDLALDLTARGWIKQPKPKEYSIVEMLRDSLIEVNQAK